MKYVIYIDVFFCVNLVMDFLILRLVSLYIKPQTTYIKCLLGAVIGSLFSVLGLLIAYENIVVHMLFSYIFIAVAMVIATYGLGEWKAIFKRCIVLYIVTIFMGGLFNFIYSYTYIGFIIHNVITGLRTGTNMIWMLGATFVSYLCLKILVYVARKHSNASMKVKVRLVFKGKVKRLAGLIDSGNSLREPYTGKPVHIVCIDTISELLEGIDIYANKFKLVPFTSLGKKHGLIKVITFDEIFVYREEEYSEEPDDAFYIEREVAIGLYEGSLSNTDEFHILLHKNVK